MDISFLNSFNEPEAGPSPLKVNRKRRRSRKSGPKFDEGLESLLEDCEFYLPLNVSPPQTSDASIFTLGDIHLKISGDKQNILGHEELWVYVSPLSNRSFLYTETKSIGKYVCIDGILDVELFSGLSSRCFKLQFLPKNQEKQDVSIRVLLVELICKEQVAIKEVKLRNAVLSYFCNIDLSVAEDTSVCPVHSMATLYAPPEAYMKLPGDVQHPSLAPHLRPYQSRSVRWMLLREKQPVPLEFDFHTKITLEDGQFFYYNKYEGTICLEKPEAQTLPRGGILADEMGLGKTVEVLALILSHPRENVPVPKEIEQLSSTNDNEDLTKSPSGGIEIDPEDEDEDSGDDSDNSSVQSMWCVEATNSRARRKNPRTQRTWRRTIDGGVVKRRSSRRQPTPAVAENELPGVTGRKKRLYYLEKWYNEMLTLNRVPKHRQRKPLPEDLVCVCGKDKKRWAKIKCNTCQKKQHAKCMGNPSPRSYHCPQCWASKDLVVSGATLIVSPASISRQWIVEIKKHIKDKNFKLLVYMGIQKHGFIQPPVIAQNHVVLTTYEILRKELAHTETASTPMLRHSKRFNVLPSALMFIEWWRICLDEAQMVENVSSKTAEMARRLTSQFRWAVTGTPIQKSVQDLFGLIQFLGVQPCSDVRYWKLLLYNPYCQGDLAPFRTLLARIMWRTIKRNVINEIKIPDQIVEIHWLNFSPVEEHFYRLQHSACSEHFLEMCSKFDDLDITLKSLNRRDLSQLLAPLLRLRQACSYHHLVKGFQAQQKHTSTMEELLQSLIKKTKLEAEEFLRRGIAALNGWAGIHLIKELWSEAAGTYRNVLKLCEKYEDSLKSDLLQRIHAMHNLAEIIEEHPDEVATTKQDPALGKEAKELEEAYMNKQDTEVISANDNLLKLVQSVKEQVDGLNMDKDGWWSEVVMWMMDHDDRGEYLARVHGELMNRQIPGQTSIINRVKSLPALQHQLALWSGALFSNREAVLHRVGTLYTTSVAELAVSAVDCHLRPANYRKEKKCPLCQCEKLLTKYEPLLFAVTGHTTEHSMVGEVLIMGNVFQGTWRACEQELILRVLLAIARSRRVGSDVVDDGTQFLKALEIMKKEFKQLRHTWTELGHRVAVRDELRMAKLRLRIRTEGESQQQSSSRSDPMHSLSSNLASKLETIHVIESHEVEVYSAKFVAEHISAERDLMRKVGQLQYLQNLEKRKDKRYSEACPVCQADVGDQWSVLYCGHCFCMDCMRMLMRPSGGFRTVMVKCPVCRDGTPSNAVSFVDVGVKTKAEATWANITVNGSHTTKIGSVIRCLLAIRQNEPHAKALVFSMWEKVLDVLQTALEENSITYRRLKAGQKYEDALKSFREGPGHITALLLPVRSGAKGLNLTEATHVLLVEPLLNPADELQATGRVHRIGQTRKTTVHHFLIRSTVEESMYQSTHASEDIWNTNSITISRLRSLFAGVCDSEPSPATNDQ